MRKYGTFFLIVLLLTSLVFAQSRVRLATLEQAGATSNQGILWSGTKWQPTTITSLIVGLGNVDNTSDANKPVSTAMSSALALKSDLASPTFTGNPRAPTQSAGTNDTTIGTTAYTTAAVATLNTFIGNQIVTSNGRISNLEGSSVITRVSESAFSSETAMGSLGTGLVVNTTSTGVPVIYAGTSCTNQFPRSLNASGVATCATVALGTDVSGILPSASFPALTGDVTTSSGAVATVIAANAVTNAKAAQMATNTIKGNNTGSTANALDLTTTQVSAMLNVFSSSLQGLVPASGGGTTNFLRADGTWAAPVGGTGTVTSVSVASANGFAGTVATPSTTPAITLTTSATGVLKGSSGALVAATSGADYAPGTSSNATGLVLSTTSTGALTAYGGTSVCTNGFIRSLNASAAATCATVALGTDVSGTLPTASLPAVAVRTDTGNTYSTGAQSFAAATSLTVPSSAGAAPTASGTVAYDSTSNTWEVGTGGSNKTLATTDTNFPESQITNLTTDLASKLTATITSPGTGNVIRYNGSIWVNAILAAADITGLATVATSGSATDLTTGTLNNARLPTSPSFSGNLSTNGLVRQLLAVTSAAGTTTLTNASPSSITVSGSSVQTIQLPDATTLQVGQMYRVLSANSQIVTVNNGAGGTVYAQGFGTTNEFTLANNSTVAGTWYGNYPGTFTSSGKMMTISNTMTLQATDGSVINFGAGGSFGLGAYSTKIDQAEASVASAATTDIGAASSWTQLITGTTTITSFGTVAAGQLRFLRFAGVLTLTHNATSLILPTAANITTAANDSLTALSLGSGNWLVYEYARANGASLKTVSLTTDVSGTLQAAQFPAMTGQVTSSVGSLATTIATNTVSNTNLAQAPTLTLKGNNTASTANEADLTVAQVQAMVTPLLSKSTTAASAAINTTATYVSPTTFSIPANTLAVGDSFKITLYGTNTSSAAVSNTWTPRMGSAGTTADTALTVLQITSATTGTSVPFQIIIYFSVRAIGASGSVFSYATMLNQNASGISPTTETINTGAATTVNTTGTLILGCSFQAAATTSTTTFQHVVVEKIR